MPLRQESATLTPEPATLLVESMRSPRYASEVEVIAHLRSMDDWRLEQAYTEGLRERARGGPSDGDMERSKRLLALIAAEMDRRIDLPWQGPLDPPGFIPREDHR